MMPGSSRNSPWTPAKRGALKELREQGLSNAEIAAKLHIGRNSISSEVRRQKLPLRPSPIKAKEQP